MRGISGICAAALILVIAGGCEHLPGKKKEPPTTQPSPPAAQPEPSAPKRPGEVRPDTRPAAKPSTRKDEKPFTPAGPQPPSQVTYYEHTIKWPGETVSIIAGWYTGDIMNWKALAEANPNLNPNLVHEGIRILIPEHMMKTKEPMPREYVESFYPPSKTKKAPPKTPSPEAEPEIPIFGPKTYPSK